MRVAKLKLASEANLTELPTPILLHFREALQTWGLSEADWFTIIKGADAFWSHVIASEPEDWTPKNCSAWLDEPAVEAAIRLLKGLLARRACFRRAMSAEFLWILGLYRNCPSAATPAQNIRDLRDFCSQTTGVPNAQHE